ncbi:MAG: hypothetical protein M1828_005301 [Chrysothrix sp. TS-e1954]|nr:MAG: hypothetical protein M1828_005301 [Chrysothrix sp. TS-e1954]
MPEGPEPHRAPLVDKPEPKVDGPFTNPITTAHTPVSTLPSTHATADPVSPATSSALAPLKPTSTEADSATRRPSTSQIASDSFTKGSPPIDESTDAASRTGPTDTRPSKSASNDVTTADDPILTGSSSKGDRSTSNRASRQPSTTIMNPNPDSAVSSEEQSRNGPTNIRPSKSASSNVATADDPSLTRGSSQSDRSISNRASVQPSTTSPPNPTKGHDPSSRKDPNTTTGDGSTTKATSTRNSAVNSSTEQQPDHSNTDLSHSHSEVGAFTIASSSTDQPVSPSRVSGTGSISSEKTSASQSIQQTSPTSNDEEVLPTVKAKIVQVGNTRTNAAVSPSTATELQGSITLSGGEGMTLTATDGAKETVSYDTVHSQLNEAVGASVTSKAISAMSNPQTSDGSTTVPEIGKPPSSPQASVSLSATIIDATSLTTGVSNQIQTAVVVQGDITLTPVEVVTVTAPNGHHVTLSYASSRNQIMTARDGSTTSVAISQIMGVTAKQTSTSGLAQYTSAASRACRTFSIAVGVALGITLKALVDV